MKRVSFIINTAIIVFLAYCCYCRYRQNIAAGKPQPKVTCPICHKDVDMFTTHVITCTIDTIKVQLAY